MVTVWRQNTGAPSHAARADKDIGPYARRYSCFVGAATSRPAFRRGISFAVGPDDPGGPLAPSLRELSPQATEGAAGGQTTPDAHPHPSFASQMPPSPWEGEGHPGSGVSPHPSVLRPGTFPQGKALGGRAADCRPYMPKSGAPAAWFGAPGRRAPQNDIVHGRVWEAAPHKI